MGMYTELNMSCRLDNATENDIKVLKKMLDCGNNYEELKNCVDQYGLQNFEIFNHERCAYMLRSESAYFSHFANSELDEDIHYYRLNVCCDLKNYEDEIQHFLDWVITLTTDEGFVGYMRYEEDEMPTIIIFKDGKVKYHKVKFRALD